MNLVTLEADVCNLTSLSNEEFEIVLQPVSSCYLPDLKPMYAEIFRVLKPGVKDPIAIQRAVAVYTELGSRSIEIPVSDDFAGNPAGPVTVGETSRVAAWWSASLPGAADAVARDAGSWPDATREEVVKVQLEEIDGEDGVNIERAVEAAAATPVG